MKFFFTLAIFLLVAFPVFSQLKTAEIIDLMCEKEWKCIQHSINVIQNKNYQAEIIFISKGKLSKDGKTYKGHYTKQLFDKEINGEWEIKSPTTIKFSNNNNPINYEIVLVDSKNLILSNMDKDIIVYKYQLLQDSKSEYFKKFGATRDTLSKLHAEQWKNNLDQLVDIINNDSTLLPDSIFKKKKEEVAGGLKYSFVITNRYYTADYVVLDENGKRTYTTWATYRETPDNIKNIKYIYYIVAASCERMTDAKRKANDFKKMGFTETFIITSGNRYRVIIKKFDNEETARFEKSKIKFDVWLLIEEIKI